MNQSIFSNFKTDFAAGLVVFFVAIPLCLGIAHASGAPLLSGLIAGVVGGVVVGFISKSPLSVSGPAAGLTAIVISGINELGTYEAILLSTVIAGILQVIFGLLKAGAISKYIPHCVIKGMLASIGLILILKQLPHLFGYDVEVMGVQEFNLNEMDLSDAANQAGIHERNTATTFLHSFTQINPIITFVGVSSLLLLFAWESFATKKMKLLPGSVLVVFVSTIVVLLLNVFGFAEFSSEHFVDIPIVDSWSSFLSISKFPQWNMFGDSKVHILAVTIALVASIESLLSLEASDRLDEHKRVSPPDRELIAQGVGNFISGLLGGLPVTSVIVRSSVNASSGAQTKMATIVHGVLIFVGMVFFATYLNYIPLAGLAAVLVFTGYKLANPKNFYQQYKQGWDQFIPSIVTTLSILLSDLLIGVAIGLAISALFIVSKSYKSSSFIVEEYGLKKRLILGESIHFLHKYKFVKFLNLLPENTTLEIDARKTKFIDHDIEEAIVEFQEVAKEKNITVIYGGLINRTQDRRVMMNANKEAYDKLIKNNKEWVREKLKLDPSYFDELSKGQTPEYLFIGCSDSRVPAEDITKCKPGEMFVHRNVANLVVSTDVNIMSVLQYAVEILNVKHVILCGHYGCGGIKAAMGNQNSGLINQWLLNIKDVYRLYQNELELITDENQRYRRLVELNSIEQAYNLVKIPFVQKQRSLYGIPEIHAWAYDIQTGLINDLQLDETIISNSDSIYSQH